MSNIEVMDINSVDFWMIKPDLYEEMYGNLQTKFTNEEIMQLLKDKMITIQNIIETNAKQSSESKEKLSGEEIRKAHWSNCKRRMFFIKKCILHQILDDLLEIPNEIRPWTSNEEKWLQEMEERQRRYNY